MQEKEDVRKVNVWYYDPIANKTDKRENKLFEIQNENFTLRANFRQLVPPVPQPDDDRYEYNSSADSLVNNSALKKYYHDVTWLDH